MTTTVLPGFLDAHVHLALIDPSLLVRGGIARVLDLGGWPLAPATSAPASPAPSLTVPVETPRYAGESRPEVSNSANAYPADAAEQPLPEIAFAHQFLTAPGGYPARQAWTPAGSVAEIATVADATAAVDTQRAAGASVVKIALNSETGPVVDDEILAAIVDRAHALGLPVVAHAQGRGQAERAFAAGVDVFAHTPFSEWLPDGMIAAMAVSMTWISTLDIHGWGDPTEEFAVASDNLRRFHLAGGRVLYGTDLGNGPLPTGLNRREVEALLAVGLSPEEVLAALTDRGLGHGLAQNAAHTQQPAHIPNQADIHPSRITFIPGARPSDPSAFVDWLCTARAVSRLELEDLQ
ncbi:amidohydrolase family protein [Leifsonia kafniensis]|uniref:Amidohydrolase family protein n=1 Tax=Leifsonia kafniensis TaxID=475957 RepID=A0ABP7KRK3_9MICO